MCASIDYKAESGPNHEEQIYLEGFSSKAKNAFFRRSKIILFEFQISIFLFCACSLMQKEASCQFHQKILIFRSPGISSKNIDI